MDLAQLANLGEFIGGVAVLVTLIYLALQVRDSTNEQRMTASREATRELASVLKTIVTTPEQAEVFVAALTDFDRYVLAVLPAHPEARYYLAMAYRQLGRTEEARELLRIHQQMLDARRDAKGMVESPDAP